MEVATGVATAVALAMGAGQVTGEPAAMLPRGKRVEGCFLR
jgi:hypothetical protein